MASGELDLATLLTSLTVRRRSGTFAVITLPEGLPAELRAKPSDHPNLLHGVEAVIREREGTTVVASSAIAADRGWIVEFEAAWLTLDVHSSLEAVGLTAAVATALADESIPCNVLAGYYHDHLLVPVGMADRAVEILEHLQATANDDDF